MWPYRSDLEIPVFRETVELSQVELFNVACVRSRSVVSNQLTVGNLCISNEGIFPSLFELICTGASRMPPDEDLRVKKQQISLAKDSKY